MSQIIDEEGFYVFEIFFDDGLDHEQYEQVSQWIAVQFPHMPYYREWTCSRFATSAVFRFKDPEVAMLFKLTWV